MGPDGPEETILEAEESYGLEHQVECARIDRAVMGRRGASGADSTANGCAAATAGGKYVGGLGGTGCLCRRKPTVPGHNYDVASLDYLPRAEEKNGQIIGGEAGKCQDVGGPVNGGRICMDNCYIHIIEWLPELDNSTGRIALQDPAEEAPRVQFINVVGGQRTPAKPVLPRPCIECGLPATVEVFKALPMPEVAFAVFDTGVKSAKDLTATVDGQPASAARLLEAGDGDDYVFVANLDANQTGRRVLTARVQLSDGTVLQRMVQILFSRRARSRPRSVWSTPRGQTV